MTHFLSFQVEKILQRWDVLSLSTEVLRLRLAACVVPNGLERERCKNNTSLYGAYVSFHSFGSVIRSVTGGWYSSPISLYICPFFLVKLLRFYWKLVNSQVLQIFNQTEIWALGHCNTFRFLVLNTPVYVWYWNVQNIKVYETLKSAKSTKVSTVLRTYVCEILKWKTEYWKVLNTERYILEL